MAEKGFFSIYLSSAKPHRGLLRWNVGVYFMPAPEEFVLNFRVINVFIRFARLHRHRVSNTLDLCVRYGGD